MGKVIIIGLDGATFDLIKPWVNDGKLPCLANLIKNGVWGNLRSVIPTISGPAWVSFMTGKNPGKHGILGFTTNVDRNDEQAQLISSLHVKDETLWQVLSSHGKRVGVLNVPITYPPQKVNGFLISGFMTPPSAKVFTYPEELKRSIPDYRIGVRRGWQSEDGKTSIRKLQDELIAGEFHDIAERRTAAAVQLMSQWDPDFFMVVFKGTDEMQHFFWGREDILLEYYQKIDKSIDRILTESSKDSNVLIISDHGFGPAATKSFSTNAWLQQAGLLKEKHDLKSSLLGTVYRLARDITTKTKLKKRLPSRSVAAARKVAVQSLSWNETKAYGRKITGLAAININLKGREPKGVVEAGHEYEELRDKVIKRLRSLKDPETGEAVMAEVFRNNEIYWGPNLAKVPDIIGIPNSRYYVDPSIFSKSIFSAYSPGNPGQHWAQLNGILIASGPDIKGGEKIEGACLIDVAPTVLHMMSLPVSQDMDGRVLNELFREDSESAQREVKYQTLDVERERIEGKIMTLKSLGRI